MRPFGGVWAIPMWLLTAVAAIPPVPARVRAYSLMLLPFAVALPPLLTSWPPTQDPIGTLPSVMLITFTLVASIPIGSWLVRSRERHADVLTLLALAVPLGVVDWLVVMYSSSAAYRRGASFTGLAPFALAIVLAWAVFIREEGGEALMRIASVALLALLVAMLFATSYRDGEPYYLRRRITSGAAAGILTGAQQAWRMEALEALRRAGLGPDDRVLVLGGPGAYLLVGGRMDTNAVWLADGPSDAETVRYFERRGGEPRMVLVAEDLRAAKRDAPHTLDDALRTDPLLKWVAQRYDDSGTAGGFRVFVRR